MKRFILYIISRFYGLGIAFRNMAFNCNLLKSREFNIPIISIGNITVGGTGKTPHTEYMIRLLRNKYKVATLSRGYGRKTKGYIEVATNSLSVKVGDEPLQMKRKYPDTTVICHEKRVLGIEKLLKRDRDDRPDVILLDDAFQHRYVKPGQNILLTDYNRLFTKDDLMPLGRLRELPAAKSRASIIIVTKTPRSIQPIEERIITKELDIKPFQNLYFTTLKYADPRPVFPEELDLEIAAIEMFKEAEILVVTGIANPKPMYEYLSPLVKKMEEMAFRDHYKFKAKDIRKIQERFDNIESKNKYIFTTEKDMVRFVDMEIPTSLRKKMFFIPLEIEFLNNKRTEFDQKIMRYVSENKSAFKLFSRGI